MFKNSVVRGLQVNSFENVLGGTKKLKQKKAILSMKSAHLMNFFPLKTF